MLNQSIKLEKKGFYEQNDEQIIEEGSNDKTSWV